MSSNWSAGTSRKTFAGTPATLVGTDGDGWNVLSRVLDLAAVALAAEQVGGAQKVLEMAVEYAKVRVQFGRPIGSFQAIKHKCADMLLEVESAKSAAYYGMWCASEMNDELPSTASLAKAYCSEAYFHAAAENIQIHGGIGFTWEHPAHLYFKRAKSSELLFGDPTYHREQLAQRIGADYHIGGLTLGETIAYVQHRLKVAGGSEDIINLEAIRLAYASSRGIPRSRGGRAPQRRPR